MNFDSTYMKVAESLSLHSKAKRAQVGACLVTQQGALLVGYNGTAKGWDNNCETENNVSKPEVLHAELNCILKAAREGVSVLGSTLYTTLSPCLHCSAMLSQAGVKRVVYRDAYRDTSGVDKLKQHGVVVEQLKE